MIKSFHILTFLIFISFSSLYGQDPYIIKGLQTINRNVLQGQLEFLASDWTEGRKAGEKGELISSDYISGMLRMYGVKPFGDVNIDVNDDMSMAGRTYFQNFLLTKTSAGPEQSLKLKNKSSGDVLTTSFTYNVDFSVRPSETVEIEAPVVFAGYGFINDKLGFNDLEGTDISGKFILRLTGTPAFAVSKLTQVEISNSKRELEKIVRSKGAAGIIDVNPDLPNFGPAVRQSQSLSPSERIPRPFQSYSSYSIAGESEGVGLVRITISLKTANEILSGTGNNIDEYRKKADLNQQYTIHPLQGKSLILSTSVIKENIPVRNVLGIIEGNKTDEIIVLGAHYDHMGMNNGYLWNGADDNGSGTVGVMTLAKSIMETGKKPEKSIIIALWTAEEEGLLGSEYFVKHPPVPLNQIRLNVNFDMISRYFSEDQKNKAAMIYTSSQKTFRELTASNLKKYNIDLDIDYQPSDDPPGGSDHRSFVAAGIPVMRFKPGHREEYHTPKDEISTIDWDIMEKITKISFANIWQLSTTDW
jgi:hypothetical protein